MKYFTMEELEDIAAELVENPSKETLKKLNSKYNSEEQKVDEANWVEAPINDLLLNNEQVAGQNDFGKNEMQQLNSADRPPEVFRQQVENLSPVPPVMNTQSPNMATWNPINTVDNTLYNSSIEKNSNNQNLNYNLNNINTTVSNDSLIPNLEIKSEPIISNTLNKPENLKEKNIMPSLELPKVNTNFTNAGPIPFNGNLWEPQSNGFNNMMQTTDNFNTTLNHTQDNQVAINQNPFFQERPEPLNNQIPVSEPPKVEGPTMFGQFEQNFNNNAA